MSYSLDAVLEHGTLADACDAFRADPGNRREQLRCGKWMFFYEGFGTMGIPAPILRWLQKSFPDEIGPGFQRYGLIPDPHATDPQALGFGAGAPMGADNSVPTLAMTCAACHFGRMPDGRYAVGYPNLQDQYGTHMLAMFLAPAAAAPGFDRSRHHPDALAAVEPLLARIAREPLLGLSLVGDLMPLIRGGGGIPSLDSDTQGHYASWAPGTMDFMIAPLPLDDGVHTVSRILPLWGIPTGEEQEAAGMDHALLAWTGSARSLGEFLSGFVAVGGGPTDLWTPERLAPLGLYIESLDAPLPVEPPDAAEVDRGRSLFTSAGCQGCHGGPAGGGRRVYDFDEVDTDAALALWADAEGDGTACCGIGDDSLTGGVKAPRLSGVHALERFLHNGSVASLEQLLCIEERPPSRGAPWGNEGHTYGCEEPVAARRDLVAFMRSLGTVPTDPSTARDPTAPGPEAWTRLDVRDPDAVVFRPEGPGPFPAVVLSHGFMLGPDSLASTGAHLASWGYLAVLPSLPGGILGGPTHVELAEHLASIVDWLASAPAVLEGGADVERLALAGHSLGGKISLLLAASDPRVDAVFGIDPVDAGPPFGGDEAAYPSVAPERMGDITAPLVVVGETTNGAAAFGPACAPTAENFERYFEAAQSPALLVEFIGASHMSFVDDPACFLCRACPAGTDDPSATRAMTRGLLVAFLARELRGEAWSARWLGGDALATWEAEGLVSTRSSGGF